jgi:hypothetical protein
MLPNFHPLKALFVCLISIQFSQAQVVTYQVLDQNNAAATFSNTGTQLVNYGTGTAQYQIPKNGGPSQLNGMQFWYAAMDVNGQLHGAFGGDLANGTDVFAGTNNPTTGLSGPNIWSITQEQIDEYHLWWLCVHQPDDSLDCGSVSNPSNDVLAVVYSWPSCFPFHDFDDDGIYNSDNGDTPIIKGCRAVYMIQNDVQGVHTYSGASSLGIQMHYLFYQFSQLSYLNEVTFADVCAVNASSVAYSDFHHGVFFDHDLTLDHSIFGCDSSKQIAYTYYPSNSSSTYSTNPPAIGIVDLDGLTTSIQPTTGALSLLNRWDLMNGFKTSGQPWVDLDGNNTAFAFDGNPNDTSSWNQLSHSDGQDYSQFLMTRDAGSLAPGQGVLASYALIYTKNGTNLQNVDRLLELSDSVRLFYQGGIYDPCTNGYLGLNDNQLTVPAIYPNPTTGMIHISDLKGNNASYKLVDIQGKTVQSGSFQNTINLSELVNGMYVLILQTSEGMAQQRVIKE